MNEIRRDLTELTDAESLALLGSVSLGRIVFTMRALPTVRPVSHLLDGDQIVIRSHLAAAIVSHADANSGAVVAYEADDLDPVQRLGWSVSITGTARILRDTHQVERYRRRLSPWVSDKTDHIIMIRPELINGFRLTVQPRPDGV
jgi:Pyridoxamine 5'-phosphate oxidase